MTRLHRNLTVLLRAERMIARRHMTVLRNQTALLALAGLVAGIALVMLNLALYQALCLIFSAPLAALAGALIDLTLAALIVLVARRMSAARDLEPVTRLRDNAAADIEAELQDVADGVQGAADTVRSLLDDPMGSAVRAVIAGLRDRDTK